MNVKIRKFKNELEINFAAANDASFPCSVFLPASTLEVALPFSLFPFLTIKRLKLHGVACVCVYAWVCADICERDKHCQVRVCIYERDKKCASTCIYAWVRDKNARVDYMHERGKNAWVLAW